MSALAKCLDLPLHVRQGRTSKALAVRTCDVSVKEGVQGSATQSTASQSTRKDKDVGVVSAGNGLAVHRLQPGPTNAFLLEFNSGLILVDAGLPHFANRIVRSITEIGRDPDQLRLIYITHAHVDHYGSAAALREITGAPIAVHRDDADDLAQGRTKLGMVRDWKWISAHTLPWVEPLLTVTPTVADLSIVDGDHLDEYGLDAVVVHTPGHTPGSSTLLVEDRLAFVGDLVSTNGGVHAQRLYARDWRQLADSLSRLQRVDPDLVFAGHGAKPIQGETFQELRANLIDNRAGQENR